MKSLFGRLPVLTIRERFANRLILSIFLNDWLDRKAFETSMTRNAEC